MSEPVPLGDGADDLPEEPPAAEPRRYPSTIGGVLYLGVLAVTLVGLVLVAVDDWRFGTKWIGAALVAAALLRLVLPAREAGMLRVRHRSVDAALLGAVGVAVIVLSESIPNQPLT